MGWTLKTDILPFEHSPIAGLCFIDGAVIDRLHPGYGLDAYKQARLIFPSGNAFDVWADRRSGAVVVHLYGEMDLPLMGTRDDAFTLADAIASACGSLARAYGDDALRVFNPERGHWLHLTFAGDQVTNVEVLR